MRSTSRMTSKGQITVPVDVRDAVGLRVGDEVSFVTRPDGVVEMHVHHASGLQALAAIREGLDPWDGPPVTIDEMNEAVAAGAADRATRAARK